ncbi:hypothetical protein CAPTEDRAFT_209527 [Capitella teleta]|uniref:Uncharacterized protein n=1 Tax=Capitella teleta TaxID=283909 RepID=R7TM87_CAPTE|nr:hypothetical protein CAPTEDRAFT_209527 [Capitella teleta]|eukprot:ELT92671.1 hypothetical protein CAPTEDRAFT_209527 [Capitella teleta]
MATYSFEHVNRTKANHINADTRNLLDGKQRAYPNGNYASGDGKSRVWSGHGFYSPSARKWQKLHEVKALPNDRIPDLIEFQSEDDWRKWQNRRDRVDSKNCAGSGFRNACPPLLKLDGYAFNPFNLYRTGVPAQTLYNTHTPWPKTDARSFPSWRGPRGYYGYYHEELDIHHNGGYRFPRDPKALANDEDAMKYEYMRNQPSLHQKQPVEFPVLL